MQKTIKVAIRGGALVEFDKLNKIVGNEIAKGITSSKHQTLYNAIKQKIEFLKINPYYGIQIQKRKIPKNYTEVIAKNLWKINLPGAWRMIYTIRGNEIEVISFVLDIFDHTEYGRQFGYKKN